MSSYTPIRVDAAVGLALAESQPWYMIELWVETVSEISPKSPQRAKIFGSRRQVHVQGPELRECIGEQLPLRVRLPQVPAPTSRQGRHILQLDLEAPTGGLKPSSNQDRDLGRRPKLTTWMATPVRVISLPRCSLSMASVSVGVVTDMAAPLNRMSRETV